MGDRLIALRERLLLAGISPRHVERYVRELSEHRNDIAEHLLESGLPDIEAHKRADPRMGDDDILVFPMLTDRRFRRGPHLQKTFVLSYTSVVSPGTASA